MADLVIRGMEKPIDCHSCWMRVYCFERGIGVWGCGKGKPCPLIPLPEGHGRLIDADAIMTNIGEVPYKGAVRRVLMSAPTIIEADLEWKMNNCCCFSNTDQAEGGGEDG